MRTLDRYIVRTFLWNYVIALAVMIGLYVMVDLYLNLDEFTEQGQPLLHTIRNIVDYYSYNLFLYFAQLAGLITVVAAAATLGKMQRSNELVAVLASGVSLYRIAAPLLVVGLLMNALWVIDQEVIIPRIADKLARPRDDVEGRSTYSIWFVPDGRGGLLSALKYSPNRKQMKRMLVIRRGPDLTLQQIITADVATWDEAEKAWVLKRGSRISRPVGKAGVYGDEARIERAGVTRYYSEITPEELAYRQATQWTDFLSIRQISQLQQRKMGPRIKLAKVKHSRVVTPLINIILLIIGIFPFMHKVPRPIIVDAGLSVLMTGAVFAVSFMAINLIDAQNYPELPAWLPVILFGPAAVILLDSVET